MKILIVNTYDRGGAANACLRLHDGLLTEGVDSKVLLKRKEKELPQSFPFYKRNEPKSKFERLKQKSLVFFRVIGLIKQPENSQEKKFLNNRQSGLEKFSFPNSNFDITSSPLYQEADIINLHWVANFLDYESFFKKNTKPVVWTLHDMNPFTGGEHYMEKVLGMDASGYPIPRTLSEEEKWISKLNLSLKLKAIQDVSNITIVAPSNWMLKKAQESSVFNNKKVVYIPYGINSEIFQPRDKDYSRDILNIPKDKTVILFVSDYINDHRKGYLYLKKAFQMLQRDDIVLCAVGSTKSGLETVKNNIELGTIYDERLMSMAYSAADVFIIPSIMDNLPNTVIESLMCGTPVIGFPVGGIKDMIEEGQNGMLAETLSSQSLFDSLELFLNKETSFNRKVIRAAALKKYALNVQARAYISLYKHILQQTSIDMTKVGV